MKPEELSNHPGWQWCTAEGAELHTLLLGLQSTFREKLEWLEEAETLTLMFREARLRKAQPDVPDTNESRRKRKEHEGEQT